MSNGNTLIHILIDAKFNNNIGDFGMLQKLFKIFNSLHLLIQGASFIKAHNLVHAIAGHNAITIAALGKLGHAAQQRLGLVFTIGSSDLLKVFDIGNKQIKAVVGIIV